MRKNFLRWSSPDIVYFIAINPLSANLTKWSNTLKQFVRNLPTNSLSVFEHFEFSYLGRLGRLHKTFLEQIRLFRDVSLNIYKNLFVNCPNFFLAELHSLKVYMFLGRRV